MVTQGRDRKCGELLLLARQAWLAAVLCCKTLSASHRQGSRNPTSAMSIVDLRQVSSRQIEPLLAEEAQHWREELRWDYRPSLNLIKKFVDAKSLAGCVAMENGRALGYSFYVVEDRKGLIGGLHVSAQSPQLVRWRDNC
jgi:hypothetical protein